jgi:VanZ family protein
MIGRFAPPLGLMAVIFALSAQPDLGTGLGGWDLLLRKLAHMAEYALLWLLWRRALGGRPRVAALIAIGYAATDEWHQSMVEGRHGTPVDVLVDAVGVAVAALVVSRLGSARDRARRRTGSAAPRAGGTGTRPARGTSSRAR